MFFFLLRVNFFLLKTAQKENIRQELNWQLLYGRRKRELVQAVAAEHCFEEVVTHSYFILSKSLKPILNPIPSKNGPVSLNGNARAHWAALNSIFLRFPFALSIENNEPISVQVRLLPRLYT